jgi:nitroreductase
MPTKLTLAFVPVGPGGNCRHKVKPYQSGRHSRDALKVAGCGSRPQLGSSFARVELAEALRRRHMVRSFSGRAVSDEDLLRVLAAARLTPSAGNTDGCDLVALVGREQTSKFWEATTTEPWRERSRRWPGLSRAPAVICVFVSPGAYLERYSEPDKREAGLGMLELEGEGEGEGEGQSAWPVPFWFFDGGAAVLAMLLAASDAGLGACFLGNFRGEAELRAALDVPAGHRYVGAVLVGEAGGVDPRSASLTRPRRDLHEAVHRGRW